MTSLRKEGTTRAVIVGISEYQDKSIGDLRFAHRDAEAFAAYLQSEVGGGLGEEQFKLLTNERATGARFGEALQWLLDNSRAGDKAIIYFSGHGDVGNSISSPEFLLLHDASSVSYLTGGAWKVIELQETITTLSVINDVSVIVIADACRSGKLGEGNLPGTSLWPEALARQKANEIKILSCKADELSREGEQWGGGRGVFSYHLLDALSGMADSDMDDVVTAQELRNYLEQKVMSEVAPARQTPSVVMPQHETAIVSLDQVHKDYVLTRQQTGIQQFYKATTKTKKEEDIFMQLDTSLFSIYKAFYRALDAKNFFEPIDSCAEYYYKQLISSNELGLMHGDIRRDYAIALQESSSTIINDILTHSLNEFTVYNLEKDNRNKEIPVLLSRASELLGTKHILHGDLMERKLFFEGVTLHWEYLIHKDTLVEDAAVTSLQKLIDHNSEYQSLAHYFISRVYAQQKDKLDLTIYHAEKSSELSPGWDTPLVFLGYALIRYHRKLDEGKKYIDQCLKKSTPSTMALMGLGIYHYYKLENDSAEICFRQILAKQPSNAMMWSQLGAVLIAKTDYQEATTAFETSLALDSINSVTHFYLGSLHRKVGDLNKAEFKYLESLRLRPHRPVVLDSLAQIYILKEEWETAIKYIEELKKYDKSNVMANAYLAGIEYKKGNIPKAKAIYDTWLESHAAIQNQLRKKEITSILLEAPELLNQN